jgi:hypothetical protein
LKRDWGRRRRLGNKKNRAYGGGVIRLGEKIVPSSLNKDRGKLPRKPKTPSKIILK